MSEIVKIQGRTPTNSVAYLQRPNNTTQYAAGDVVSEVTTNDHFVFADASNQNILTGKILGCKVEINCNAGTKPDLELWLFDTDIAEVADNSAFAPTDAEILTLVGVIAIPVASFKVGLSGSDAAGNVVQLVSGLIIPFKNTANSARTLYGQLVARNTYTPIANEQFSVSLFIERD